MPGVLALYIHWPFCQSKCPYCDFNSYVRDQIDIESWRHALLADLAFEARAYGPAKLTSVFFGGGTPSLAPPALVEALINEACRHWQINEQIEITLEANPSSTEAACFSDLAAAGVNRLSLGVQALNDADLHKLGRHHSVAEALAALSTAQRYFKRVSMDLIYARPEQTLQNWSEELQEALTLSVEHYSLYQLTIEENTPFAAAQRKGQLSIPNDNQAAKLYLKTQEIMGEAGYPAYEISNHAPKQARSRHNMTYWTYGDYVGIGPGAHGRRHGIATKRISNPEAWMTAVGKKGSGLELETYLDPGERAREALLMGLRLSDGVDLNHIRDKTGLKLDAIIDLDKLENLTEQAYILRQGERIWIAPKAQLVTNHIIAQLAHD